MAEGSASPRRIGFDALRALRNTTGLGNYSRALLSGLHAADPALDLHLYSTVPPREEFRDLPSALNATTHFPTGLWGGRALRSLWRTFRLGRAVARDRLDLYHGLSHEIPRDLPATGIRSVVTFLDLIYHHHPEYFPAFDRRSYEWRYRWSAEHASAIVAISRETRNDLIASYGIPRSRITVIPPARDPRFGVPVGSDAMAAVRARYRLDTPFLLSVGTLEPRKNQALAIEAVARLGAKAPQLVLVGRDGGSATALAGLAAARGVTGRVLILKDVGREELPALMQAAALFLYPSRVEGFGMPIVEALSAGVPVVTTAGGCFEEAGGPAARYVEPGDPASLADQISNILGDPALATRMREAGLRHARQFDGDALARRLLAVYDAVIRDQPLPAGAQAPTGDSVD